MGSDGQNHILAQTPIKLLPASEFEKSRNSCNDNVAEITAGMIPLTMQADDHSGIDESYPQTSGLISTSSKSRPPKKTKRKPKYVIKW